MRKHLVGIFACLFSLPVLAAVSDSSVIFKASFLKNELQSYEISRAEYAILKNDTTSLERIRFKANVYVTDSTENYYVLNWKFSDFSINTDNLQLKQLMALAKPVEVSYRITKPGVFVEFLNGENVTKCLENALPEVLAPFAGQEGTSAKSEIDRIYGMRETLETLLLRSIYQFHQVYGLGYTLGEIVDVPTEVTSRFSPKPIKGIIRKKLQKIDQENHYAILSMATFLDEKEFQKALREYLNVHSIPEATANQENMGSVVMDLSTGWLIWSIDQKETIIGKNRYGETVEIKYIP